VRDLATIERVWKDESIRSMGTTGNAGNRYVSLKVLKKKGTGIFEASDAARSRINEVLSSSSFSGLNVRYSMDIADNIRDDYAGLSHDAILTVILVFVSMFLYIGLKDAIISTIFLPLAFFSTFFILYISGYSLNFLTNFSLVLSFGIAIDTIIVIIQ
jgi:multidrug efflux pump subunit AcrB